MIMRTLAAGAAMLLAAPVAMAEMPVPTQTVTYQPDDLAHESGRTALKAELETAARAVCRDHGRRDLAHARAVRACIDDALDHAYSQLETRLAQDTQDSRVRRIVLSMKSR